MECIIIVFTLIDRFSIASPVYGFINGNVSFIFIDSKIAIRIFLQGIDDASSLPRITISGFNGKNIGANLIIFTDDSSL